MQQFEHVAAKELPAVLDEPTEDARAALLDYVQELRDWLAGILNWHQEVRRYKDDALEEPVRVGTLTGLGTSAARHLVS